MFDLDTHLLLLLIQFITKLGTVYNTIHPDAVLWVFTYLKDDIDWEGMAEAIKSGEAIALYDNYIERNK